MISELSVLSKSLLGNLREFKGQSSEFKSFPFEICSVVRGGFLNEISEENREIIKAVRAE
jgi:hypothetical protein